MADLFQFFDVHEQASILIYNAYYLKEKEAKPDLKSDYASLLTFRAKDFGISLSWGQVRWVLEVFIFLSELTYLGTGISP